MSLEEQIGRLAKAVERNNELLELGLEGREALLKAAGKINPKNASNGDEEKTPVKRKKKVAEGAEEAEKPAPKAKAAKIEMQDEVSIDELLTAYGAWINSTTDKAKRTEMKEFISAVLDELGVKKLAEIEAEDCPKALYWLEQKKAGLKVNFGEDLGGSDGEDDDEDLLGASKAKKTKRVVEEDDEDEEEDEE